MLRSEEASTLDVAVLFTLVNGKYMAIGVLRWPMCILGACNTNTTFQTKPRMLASQATNNSII